MYLTSKVESTHLSFVNVTLNKYKHDKRDTSGVTALLLPAQNTRTSNDFIQYETLAASLAWMNLDGLDELGWRWRKTGRGRGPGLEISSQDRGSRH